MKRWLCAALIVALAVCAGFALRRVGVGLVKVAGTSMRPTLQSGDIALATRWDYLSDRAPRRGDVVECRFPGRAGAYLKRVVGLPGETVAFLDGTLTIDGQPVSEPYVSSPTADFEAALGAGEYLALGDNRAESYDSRMDDMGALNADAFTGRVRWIVWPLSRFGPVM